jgi:RNA ligase
VNLADLFPLVQLEEALEQRYVRRQAHPDLPLSILNYTERCAYDAAWTPVTRQCRGLIYETGTLRVVARPFLKFFNYGEPNAPELDLDAPAVVTDKMDGSLGILYPTRPPLDSAHGTIPAEYGIATRGSFASEQAVHATELLRERYLNWSPDPGLTYLFEIVYPENRIVLDYGATDDLFLLTVLETETGRDVSHDEATWSDLSRSAWPGPRTETHDFATLAGALAAEPRPNREGLVVYLPDLDERVKIKQTDYVALHRILTGTNARHVYEFAAVRACSEAIARLAEGRDEGKLWASFVGLDPARVEQLQAAGDGWLEATGIPDEFYDWVRSVIDTADAKAGGSISAALEVSRQAAKIENRAARYSYVRTNAPIGLESETMRLASDGGRPELDRLICRAWREAAPEPTAPFQRPEAVA